MYAQNGYFDYHRPAFVESNFYEEANIHRLFQSSAEFLRASYLLRPEEIEQAEDKLKKQLTERGWRDDDEYGGIDFDDLRMCCAYLRRYATCHACLVRHVTKHYLYFQPYSTVSRLINQRETLKIVSAGGGPGNDLIGFCSALLESMTNLQQLNLTVVDLKGGWRRAYNEVMYKSLNYWSRKVTELFSNVHLNYKFVQRNLCASCPFEVRDADLILMVKLLSNVSFVQKFDILDNIFSAMKPGAIFFFIDIDAEMVAKKSDDYFMKVLALKSRQKFTHSLTGKMNFTSTYEVCILQKMRPPCNFY